MTASVFVVVNATFMTCRRKNNGFWPLCRSGVEIVLSQCLLNLVPSQGLERDNGPNCVVAAAIVMAFPRKKQRFLAGFPIWRYLARKSS